MNYRKSNFHENLEKLCDEIRDFTFPYIRELGLTHLTQDGFISCLSPDHDDSNPSEKWWPEAKRFRCFGCGAKHDIFDIAYMFEKRPAAGVDYIEDTIFYLADKFSIAYSHLKHEVTEEKKIEMAKYQLMKYFAEYVVAHSNAEYLLERNITKETATALQIGSVDSYANLEANLTSKGFTVEMMRELGIDEYKINENKLIFVVRNKYGRPVGFASREMKYTTKAIEKIMAEKGIASPLKEIKARIKEAIGRGGEELLRATAQEISNHTGLSLTDCFRYISTPKYINGKENDLYKKREIFYGYSDIKKEFNPRLPLIVVEGYVDFVTAYGYGFRNIIALGSASFTEDHLMLLEKDERSRKVAFALDQDAVGELRMENVFTNMLKGRTDLSKSYMFARYKQQGKDLDEILVASDGEEKVGYDDVFDFLTMFDYELENIKRRGEFDHSIVFEEFTKLMCITERPKDLEEQAVSLSKLVNYSAATIMDEVRYLKDKVKIDVSKEVARHLKEALVEVERSPEHSLDIVEDLRDQVKEITEMKFKKKTDIFETSMQNLKMCEEEKTKVTNYQIDLHDLAPIAPMGLTPGDFFVLTAKSHIGKTTVYQKILLSSLERNDNTVAFYFSTDDPLEMIISNLIAAATGLPRDYCKNPYFHENYGLETSSYGGKMDMFNHYETGRTLIEGYMAEKRLVILDTKNGIDQWRELLSRMKEIHNRKEMENKFKILFVDAVNKVTVPGIMDDNQRSAYLSEYLKKGSENYKFLTFGNFELNKTRRNQKATSGHLSGSRRIYLDSTVLTLLHNPFHEFEGETELFWWCNKYGVPIKMPVIVWIMEKSKVGGIKDQPFFFKLDSRNNMLESVAYNSEEHKHYKSKWYSEQYKYQGSYGNQQQ